MPFLSDLNCATYHFVLLTYFASALDMAVFGFVGTVYVLVGEAVVRYRFQRCEVVLVCEVDV